MQSLKKFLMVFLPYIVVLTLSLLFEILVRHNVDAKGWWPVALILGTLFQGIIACIYIWIDKLAPSSYRYTACYAMLFILPLLILFISDLVTPIDWLAVNNGVKSLTLWQSVTNSDWFSPICTMLILLTHFISRYQSAQRQRALV